MIVVLTLFVLFALVVALFSGLAGHWEAALGFLTIGVLVIPISRIPLTWRWVWPTLFELLWYMGGKPYDFSRIKRRSQAASSSPCPERSDERG